MSIMVYSVSTLTNTFCPSNSVSPVLYYWTLFFPSLGGAAILLIASMLGGYGGIVCALLFPWLARSIFTQYHRITTYQRCLNCAHAHRWSWFLLISSASFFSRLPNPVYLGTLLAGLFHSLLCFYGRIMPNILHKQPIWKIMHLAFSA